MKRWSHITLLAAGLLVACSAEDVTGAAASGEANPSVFTGIGAGDCTQETDYEDPNETVYLLCPGVAGYGLIVRQVDSGRQSVDVVSPTERLYPLDYQLFVTRHMTELGNQAEWRLATDGSGTPVALVIPVMTHENPDTPGVVTHSYLAVAKIAAAGICVSGRIALDHASTESVAALVERATRSACLQPLPPEPEQ